MKLEFVVVLSCICFATAHSQYMIRLKDSTAQMYVNTVLGLSFQYHERYEFFDTSYPIAKETWRRRTDDRLGISFLAPRPYESRWQSRHFWLWRPATDSVLSLDFGGGASVQIYNTTMSLPEIAFAEGFKQYQNDTTPAIPRSRRDSLPSQIIDSKWVLIGISGMPTEVQPLNGTHWKGLRGQSDTRANLPEQSTTYIDEVFISFLANTSSPGGNIVFVFRKDPDDNSNIRGHKQPQRLSEAGFYDLVASVKWIKKK